MNDTNEFVELTLGTEAVPAAKSMAHRLFFEQDGKFLPVKGEFVSLPFQGEGGCRVHARLFSYVLEGPPFVLPQTEPQFVDQDAVRRPTRYEVTAINAIHAREDVLASTAFRPGGYGPGFKVLYDQLEEGCPEAPFGAALTSALAAYDAMVEGAEDYDDWEAKHAQFMTTLPNEQHEALCTVYARSNVGMEMRFRASRSDHWNALAKPMIDAQNAEVEAEAAEISANREALEGVAGKFRAIVDSLTEQELKAFGGAVGAEDMTHEGLLNFLRLHGERMISPSAPPAPAWADTTAPFASFGAPFSPLPDGDWVELSPGSFPGAPFPFPGMPVGAGVPPIGGIPGVGGIAPVFPPLPGMSPFTPGPNETFTTGSREADDRKLEAATAEADALRARLHADANERRRKLGAFKDAVAGGLHWLLGQVEGAPAALPPEPVGPVEQIMGRTGVNGSRASVMDALQGMTEASGVGAPGESF